VNCRGDLNNNQCTLTGGAQAALGKKVFVVGDSLTYGMVVNGEFLNSLAIDEFVVNPSYQTMDRSTSSPRVTGPSVEATGGINTKNSIVRLDEHPFDLAPSNTDIILVALGTNYEDGFVERATDFTNYLRLKNPTAAIVWVNTYYTGSRSTPYKKINDELALVASTNNFKIIDYAKAAEDDVNLQPDVKDGVHYNPIRSKNRGEFISGELKKLTQTNQLTSTSNGQNSSSGSPLSLTYPALSNEIDVQNSLTDFIETKYPSSPWLTVSNNIGQWLFEKSKEMNVNPLLVASIGKQENQFGTTKDSTSVNNYNYFGMKQTKRFSDPRIGGIVPREIEKSNYIGFSSPTEGLEFFIRYLAINTQGENRGPYREVQNFYEYISMHQAGQIAYPGEPLVGGDSEMGVAFDWNSSWNPKIYYENSIEFINKITGLTLSPIPTKGIAPAGCVVPETAGVNSTGKIDSTGYWFPLNLDGGKIGGITAGQTTTTHHDNTPAFDLFGSKGKSGGDPVFAIYGGVIDNISVPEPGWCYGIQLKADDTFYYFYGHLNNLAVTEGQTVKVGQYLGEIALWTPEHNCNGSSGATHLHIDRGCVLVVNGIKTPQRAGSKKCRDPDFIPFLSGIYERSDRSNL
jgi:hypothetical protein